MRPVTGTLPKRTVKYHRSAYFNIAVSLVYFAPIFYKRISEHHSVGKEEGEAGAFVHYREKSELFSELAMVTLLCLFKHIEVCGKGFLCRESRTVNSLKHFVFGVAFPICTCALCELEGFYRACGEEVRTCAKVGEFSLFVERDLFAFGDSVYKKNFIRLTLFFHKLFGFFTGKSETLYFEIFFYYLLHFGFDFFKLFSCECYIGVEIVIKAVVNSRSYGELYLGVKALYCLCENMRCCVEERLFSAFIFKCEKLYVVSVMDGVGKLVRFAVDFRSYYFARNGNACRFSGFINGKTVFNTEIFAVDSDFHRILYPFKNNIP